MCVKPGAKPGVGLSASRRKLLGKRARSCYNRCVVQPSAYQFAIEIARLAADAKSEDVVALDLRGISPVTDFTVICTGTSDRQMRALAEHVLNYGKKVGEKPYGVCGTENATWIVQDFVDVVVHIFAKPYRVFYDLELLWGDAPYIDWARSETA